ncbi:MAG: large subunit ribosomal protein [Candidatus Sumerlaeota bacterium]|nr:large subunit ribosomal protein [Candidatus Sumerlaeota bacterium]
MSRIGKLPIAVPKGVDIKVDKAVVNVKGPKGTLSVDTLGRVDVKVEDGNILVARYSDDRQSRAFHGLYQRLISNCVKGVSEGFKKELEIQGVGYRAAVQGKKLVLSLGYSHPIEVDPPAGVTFSSPKQTEIVIEGADKQVVGQVAANIRGYRPPEPYKGKGVRYKGEYVRRKVGKSGGK